MPRSPNRSAGRVTDKSSIQNYRDDPEFDDASGHYLSGEQVLKGREGLRSYLIDHADERLELAHRPRTRMQHRVIAFTWLGIAAMVLYGMFMVLASFAPGYRPIDYVALGLLLFSLGFVLLHGIGYANQMIKSSWGYAEVRNRAFAPQVTPKVVCLIASFNEPAELLEETVSSIANLDYPNKEIIILDDSTKDEARQATRDIAEKYGVHVRQRTNRRGYKAGAINDYLPETDATYLAIFDADCMPSHNFLRDVVPILMENPRLSFVQTPQYYANGIISSVAQGALSQQSVFYEYIMEGKSQSRAAFCCGTNVVFSVAALSDVDGFDESSVTEDFATSLKLHQAGYDSSYYNQVYGYGLAPETLAAFFVQQGRWALGTTSMILPLFKSFLAGPKKMSMGQWWEYFLSVSYYWIGWVNFFFLWMPILYIFFDVRPLHVDVFTYIAIFVPYFLFTMNMFYAGMEQRGYSVGQMILGQQAGFACFPIHMSAVISGMLGQRKPFGVTPKGDMKRMSWVALWPQLLMLAFSAAAFLWGMYHYFWGADRNTGALFINSSWALFNVFMLSGLFYLNRVPLDRVSAMAFFGDEPAAAASTAGLAGASTPVANGKPSGMFGPTAPSPAAPSSTASPPAGSPAAVPVAASRVPGGWTRRLALMISIVSVLGLGTVGLTMLSWAMNPTYPVNVYILDRTTGSAYEEHRVLTWTLNFLKVRRQADFGASGEGVTGASGENNQAGYHYARDFYGFVPGEPVEVEGEADLQGTGEERALPSTLQTPGALYISDTYGEFVDYNYRRDRAVRYTANVRGLTSDDVEKIQDFYDRKGLVIAEWNTLGYPPLPSENITSDDLRLGIFQLRENLEQLRNRELPLHRQELETARRSNNRENIANAEQRVAAALQLVRNHVRDLNELAAQLERLANADEHRATRQKMEQILHIEHQGWYGRFVEDLGNDEESDYRWWGTVSDRLAQKYPDGVRGPGLIFYRDGEPRVFNVKTNQFEPNPLTEPVVITQDELGTGSSTEIALIQRTAQAGVANDPLLQGVSTQTPYRYWFDVVRPRAGSRVLSYHKLRVKSEAAERLRARGFPEELLSLAGDDLIEITLPAAVAYREGDDNQGALRSLYLAGEASDYVMVSRIAEVIPATGGVLQFFGSRLGSVSSRYYWNYYSPMLKNIFSSEQIRHNGVEIESDNS